jgi:Protein of unknown function (DUF3592)
MLIVLGVWVAIAGGVSALAGLSGMRRVRRLRRDGVAVWALPVTEPVPADQPSGDQPSPDPPPRMLLQYSLEDGRVLERSARARVTRSPPLRPGEPVLIWYDPADPDDVLIYGRWGRVSDRAFVTAGTLLILIGAAIAFGP